MKHYEKSIVITAQVEDVFAFIDDHTRFSAHMNKSSWIMGGSRMNTSIDEKLGKEVGSHIRMYGKFLGIELYLDEVVTHREPPHLKTWKTVGIPKLLVVGDYQMRIEIKNKGNGALLTVSIDYELPTKNVWIGKLFGGLYAKWCVEQMLKDPRDYFIKY